MIRIISFSSYKFIKKFFIKGICHNKNKINMKCDIEIVRPNYFFVLDEKTYKKINIYRKAYVFTLEDISKTKIYVDCTTGEIIGGNANLWEITNL